MPELRTGFDYHLAEVHRTTDFTKGPGVPVTYQARCNACGWVGHVRTEKGATEDDAAAHDVAENPG